MAYRVIETELASRDLDSILRYITVELANPSAASAFADELEACYSDLERMPMMYGACSDTRLKDLGYRKAVIKNYVMVYKIEESSKTVSILRFFYGRRDYEKLI